MRSLGQGGQTLGLAADIGKPLVFSALHLGQIGVCADDGHGGFQLVGGVGPQTGAAVSRPFPPPHRPAGKPDADG